MTKMKLTLRLKTFLMASLSVTKVIGGSLRQLQQLEVEDTGGTGNIVGGRPERAHENYGFSAKGLGCGLTLIHPDVAMSAAHCLGSFDRGIRLGGRTLQFNDVANDFYSVRQEIAHPNYRKRSNDYDVMLIVLNEAVRGVAPMKLNFNSNIPVAGDKVKAIGYGTTTYGGSISDELMGVRVTTTTDASCKRAYASYNKDLMVCAADSGRDSCQGDSGGPLMTTEGVQVGIVSYGYQCAREGFPGVYSRVSSFEDFIKGGICQLSDISPDWFSCSDLDEINVLGSPQVGFGVLSNVFRRVLDALLSWFSWKT